jgi:hypothetical protein
MRPVARRVLLVAAGLLGALLVTLLSVHWERQGTELVENGNLCGPNHDEICWEPALEGGLPLAWVRDIPTISVPGEVHWVEDHVRPAEFWIDLAFWFAVLAIAWRVLRRRSRGVGRG